MADDVLNGDMPRRLAEAEAALDAACKREASLRESEERYRSLFQRMGQGYCELKLLRDETGRAVDQRYLAFNPAFERLFGISVAFATGRTANKVFPGLEPWWHEAFDRIAQRGQPERIEHFVASLDRAFEVYVYPTDQDHLTVLYEDVTQRRRAEDALRQSEERQAFLLKLGDAMRAQSEANAIIEVAARLLGERMNASRIMFAEFDEARGIADIFFGWFADGALPFPAVMQLEEYEGPILDDFRAGRTVRIGDTNDPALARPDLVAIAQLGVAALLSVPLIVGSRLLVNLSIHQHTARRWTDEEVRLTQEVAERLWADLVRVRAEAALRKSEVRFQQFAASSSDALWIRDAATLEMEYVSPAIAMIYGVPPDTILGEVKRWAALIIPDDRDQALQHLEQARHGEASLHEFRIKRPADGSFRWIRNTDFPLLDKNGRVERIGGIAQDVTEAKLAADHTGVLLAELQHRVRNIMGMIRSLANRSALGAMGVEDYRSRLEGRLLALARVQALLTREANAGGSLRDIIESEVAAQAHHGGQFALTGPDVALAPKAVEVLTLALHELATNALKYGALSVPEGRLRVTWAFIEKRGKPWLSLDWLEEGGPLHESSTQRGFGTELIEGRIPYELGGWGKITIAQEGARCHLEFPLRNAESILETDAPEPATIFGGTLDMSGAPDLTGRKILVVEDDYFLASDTAAALRGAGAKVLGPCPSAEAARDLIEDETPTHAVVDLNLGGGGPRFEIAHLLKARGVPFIFVTGYDPGVIPPEMAEVMRLQKPLPLREIVKAVSEL